MIAARSYSVDAVAAHSSKTSLLGWFDQHSLFLTRMEIGLAETKEYQSGASTDPLQE